METTVYLTVKDEKNANIWSEFQYFKPLEHITNNSLASMFFEAKNYAEWKPSTYDASYRFYNWNSKQYDTFKATILVKKNNVVFIWR